MSSSAPPPLAEARTADGMTLAEIGREVRGAVTIQGDPSIRVFGVQNDSRQVTEGDMFVVRQGLVHDGRAFVAEAAERGAIALLAASDLSFDRGALPVLRVPDIADALAYASAAVYGHPAFSLDIVGITGTNGKTTTAHLVRAAIDGAHGRPLCGVVGTVGHTFDGRRIDASHTTPEADELARVLAVMKKRGATHVAMEVSSIALVLRRVEAVRFRVAAFTNLTQDHLDFHRTMDAYGAAKMELFTRMAPGLAVVNVDDPFGALIAEAAKCKVLRVRTHAGARDADVYPERVETSGGKTRISARVPGAPGGRLDLVTRFVGAHNVENLLVAIGTVAALELDVERAATSLATERGAPGRLERCDGPDDDLIVLVDYAHTPDALARVLDAVREAAAGKRVICVFGCGGERDPSKRAPMGEAVSARADVTIITSDNPRTEDPSAIVAPIEGAVRAVQRPISVPTAAEGGVGYIVELDRHRAIAAGVAIGRPGDIVLIAGKGHEDYQIVGVEKRPFDDRLEARAALTARRAAKAG